MDPGFDPSLLRRHGPKVALAAGWALLALLLAERLHALAAGWRVVDPASLEKARSLLFPLMHASAEAPAFLCAAASWRRRMPVWLFALAVALAGEVGSSHLVDGALHAFLVEHGLHPLQWAGWRERGFNSQWTRLLVYGPAVAAFAGAMCVRPFRSLDRCFVLAIALSIPLAGSVFHKVAVTGILDPETAAIRSQLLAGLDDTPSVFASLCRRWEARCFVSGGGPLDLASAVPIAGDRPDPSQRDWFGSVDATFLASGHDGAFAGPRSTVLALSNLDFAHSLNGYARRNGSVRGAIVTVPLDAAIHRAQMWFCFLAVTAWTVWIFGGFALLAWHGRVRKRRGLRPDGSALM